MLSKSILGSLKGRLLLGLLCALLILAGLVLGMAWQVGKTMVQEANMAHMRYEADLIADEVTQQIDHRFQALERLSDVLGMSNDPEWLGYELSKNDALLAWFDAIVVS
ncbi:diguanylate cyclase, partial [Vreelandella alkaliphila]